MGSVIMCEVFKIRSVSAEVGEQGDWEVSGWCIHRGSTDYDKLGTWSKSLLGHLAVLCSGKVASLPM